ncbi:hypothetical protein ABIC89_000391 [Variovorax boronicumulans]|uniref:hypothetical protein n=1 Tax=Variovorax boronicumulans TaxID=436515 RepID=UPI003394CC90
MAATDLPTLPASPQLANGGEANMTRTEFLSWAKTARLRNTASLEAARMVLTGDMRPGDAAKAAGCSPQAVTNVLRKIKDAMKLRVAAGEFQPESLHAPRNFTSAEADVAQPEPFSAEPSGR